MERAGVNLQYQLPGLKEPTDCKKEDCFIHLTGGKGDRRKEGLLYKGTCLTCQKQGPSSEIDRDGRVKVIEGQRKGSVELLG